MSTRAQLLAEIAAQFPDNNSGLITPAKLRQVVEDLANSCNNSTDEGTPAAAVATHAELATVHGIPALASRVSDLEAGPVASAGRYNVIDYGAVGDGVTDDTAAVQAAINAADDEGGIVYFGNSTYRVSALTLPGNKNVHLLGDQAQIIGALAGNIITVTGFPNIYKRVHIENIAFSADATGVTAIQVSLCALYLKNCNMALSVDVGVHLVSAINSYLHDCTILTGVCALWLEGTLGCYSGFMEATNCRFGGEDTVCAIYSDATLYLYGSGGINLNSCWFEGFGGLAIYGKGDAKYDSPIVLRGCWFEGIGGDATVDLSDLGGPASVDVDGYPIYLDNSSLHADAFWSSIRLRNNSTLSARRLFYYPLETTGMIDCDASSVVDIDDVQCLVGGGGFSPFGSRANVRAQNATFVECPPKSLLDTQHNNLMGVTGVASTNFYVEPATGVTVTEGVRDTTAPTFKGVVELSIDTTKNCPVYARPDWLPHFTAGRYYAISYSLRLISGTGNVRLNWGNQTPIIPYDTISDGKWHTFTGILESPNTADKLLYINHDGAGTVVLRVSAIQVVEFTDAQSAYKYSASDKYATLQAGVLMPATLPHRISSGAPTFNAEFIGQECADMTNSKWYKAFSVGSGAGDWAALN